MIEAKRTPEDRFAHLPGFPYTPHYVEDLPGYQGLRAAYIDEGPQGAPVFLCLHGEPSWSYLYRRMIPVFLESGGRVVAPDFLGFGRSDKPVKQSDYSFPFHRDWLIALIERLDLTNVTLVVQDWGGLIGLTLPVHEGMRARIARLIVMNTGLATGQSPGPGFMAWKNYALSTPDLPIGALIARGTPHLTPEEIAAYDAPFPDASYKAGAQVWPALVPVEPDMPGAAESRAAAEFWSNDWSGPTFMAVGDADPVLGPPQMAALAKRINGCPEPLMIKGGGHFVQEWGEEIARAALAHFGGR
ncbi:MAG: haloalkane dehalogenase [Proteobacteria bacterium SG_bin5]|nr:alpha/beta fold hydrolase [Sphingomonas sp.]OQW39937.1 MAG: haloalkane dehalogenase [Proteobacteria bacterium SG_bin5]